MLNKSQHSGWFALNSAGFNLEILMQAEVKCSRMAQPIGEANPALHASVAKLLICRSARNRRSEFCRTEVKYGMTEAPGELGSGIGTDARDQAGGQASRASGQLI